MRQLLLFSIWTLCSISSFGQNPINQNETLFRISELQVNEYNGDVIIEIIARSKGAPVELSAGDLEFFGHSGVQRTKLHINSIEEIPPEEKENLTILFLLDISGSMAYGNKFEGAKSAVLKTMQESDLPVGTTLLLSTFHDEVSSSMPFSKANIATVLDSISTTGKDTDLYSAIMSKTSELTAHSGKKVLILLSDGEHDVRRNPKYSNGLAKPTRNGVFERLGALDHDVLVFPIGLGAGADELFLQAIVDSTQNNMDLYSFSSTPSKLDSIFTRLISGLTGNYRIELNRNTLPYKGDLRQLEGKWITNDRAGMVTTIDSFGQSYRAGSINFPIPSVMQRSLLYTLLIVGLGIVILLFIALSLLIPLLRERDFKQKYVSTYHRTGNLVAFDTVTNEPIADGALVVNKCKQIIPLHVWEGVGSKCPHFPECIHSLDCDGAGAKEINANFFSQKGAVKKLNWLWFGSAGGFFSWVLYALYRAFPEMSWHHDLVSFVLEKLSLSKFDAVGACENCMGVANETYVGICVGIGLAAGLAIPEQLSRLQTFSVVEFIGKTILGALIGGFSFLIGSLLHPEILASSFLSGLVTWMIFGVLFGLVVTIRSYIPITRAVLASTLASFVSFLIYYFAFMREANNVEPLRLISLIVLGAIIGTIIVTVVSNLEEYELEFLAPDQYRGHMIPISKWMQQGLVVSVGKAPKNQVFIKWMDEEVLDKHAEFSKDQNTIFIQPIGEVLINGILIINNKRTPLKHMDIIQLGRGSRTQIRYKEKRTSDSPDQYVPPITPADKKG